MEYEVSSMKYQTLGCKGGADSGQTVGTAKLT